MFGCMKKRRFFFRIFYKRARFYWVGIRATFALGRCLGLLFFELRGMMVGINAALSIGYWLAILGTLVSLAMLLISPAPLALIICLGVDTVYWWLWRLERREAKFHRLKPFSIYNINVGCARVLRGNVGVGHLFIGEGLGRSWTRTRRKKVLQRATVATRWIQGQAEVHGVTVAFDHEVVSPDLDLSWPLPSDANDYQTLMELRRLVRGATAGFRAKNEEVEVCFLVHSFRKLRSYAVPALLGDRPVKTEEEINPDERQGERPDEHREDGEEVVLEFAVMGPGANPGAHAHELLHMFGADDYYKTFSSMDQIFKERFIQRSIMFNCGAIPLEKSVISALTAQNIGWK